MNLDDDPIFLALIAADIGKIPMEPDPEAFKQRHDTLKRWQVHRDDCYTCKPWSEHETHRKPRCHSGRKLVEQFCQSYAQRSRGTQSDSYYGTRFVY